MSEYCTRFERFDLDEASYPMKIESVKVTIGFDDWILTEKGEKCQESHGPKFQDTLQNELKSIVEKLPVKPTQIVCIENGIKIEWPYPHHLTVSNDDDVTWFGEDVLDYILYSIESKLLFLFSCTVTFKVYDEAGSFELYMEQK